MPQGEDQRLLEDWADEGRAAASFMAKHPTAVMGRVYILPVVKLPWDED